MPVAVSYIINRMRLYVTRKYASYDHISDALIIVFRSKMLFVSLIWVAIVESISSKTEAVSILYMLFFFAFY